MRTAWLFFPRCLRGAGVVLISVFILFVVPAALAGPSAPSVTFLGAPSSLNTGTTFQTPAGVAVDAMGDVFVVDSTNGSISEILAVNGVIPASPQIQTLSITISGSATVYHATSAQGMGIDSSGDLFVTGSNGLFEVTASSSYATAVRLSSYGAFYGVALDPSNNLFVVDMASKVREFTFSSSYASSSNIITGINYPTGIAVDANDDVFVFDSYDAEVLEYVNSSGTYGSATTLPGSFTIVDNMAMDAFGNLIVPDDMNGVYVFPASTNYTSQITLNGTDLFGTAAAVGPNGNIMVAHNPTADPGYGGVYQLAMAPNFGSTSLGTTTPTQLTLPFQIASWIGITSVSVLTMGAPNLDFQLSSACHHSDGTPKPANCNVVVNFLPLSPGLRRGAVVVNSTDGSSNYTTTVPIYGVADAPQLALNPGVASVLTGSSGPYPYQVAIDGSGNVYETSYSTSVYEIPAGGGSPTTLTSALSVTTGLAIDGAGNLYVVNSGSSIVALTPSGQSWTVPVAGFGAGDDDGSLAMDGAGNLYIADENDRAVLKVAIQNPGTALVAGVSRVLPGNYTLGHVYGVAVDNVGNVYASDKQNNDVLKITSSGTSSALTFPNSITLSQPYGVTVDAFGNIYISDSNNSRVIEQMTNGTTQIITPSIGIDFPLNTTLDSAGRLYISDYGGSRIVVVDPTTPPTQRFATTAVGQTSSDSPHTASYTNIGDQDLNFAGVAYPASFPANAGDSDLCSTSVPLTPGASCDVSVNFTPQTAGSPVTGNIQLTDNNLNAANSTQSISLVGTATATATSTTFALVPNPPTAGQTATFTATVSPAPSSPYGSVNFMNGSALLGTGTVNSQGVAVFTTTSLAAGAMSVTAVYSGNGGYSGSTSAAQSITVAAGAGSGSGSGLTSTHIALATSPNPVTAGIAVTLTATVTPAPTGSSPGTVKFYSGETLLATITLASGVASYTIETLPGGSDSLTAVYSGNASFAGATSSVVSQTVNPAYTVSAPQTPYAVSAGGAVQVNVTVPPLGGAYNSPVTMSASGLPPGATATFTPAVVTPGANGAATVMTISLGGLASRVMPRGGYVMPEEWLAPMCALCVGACALSLRRGKRRRRNRAGRVLAPALLVPMTVLILGCGGGFSNGSKATPGSYAVTITGTSGSLHASTTVTVVVQ